MNQFLDLFANVGTRHALSLLKNKYPFLLSAPIQKKVIFFLTFY